MVAAAVIANKNYGSSSGFLFGSFKKDLCGRWLVLAIVHPLLIFVASVAPLAFLGQPLDLAGLDWVQSLPLFPVMVFMNVWEEIGWRGYALPKLQERRGGLVSGIIVGVFWSLWHWPHLVVKDSPMLANSGSVLLFVIMTTLNPLIFTAVYNLGRGNLLVPTFLHAAQNAWGIVVMIGLGVTTVGSFLLWVDVAVAVALVLAFGTDSLAPARRARLSDIIEWHESNERLPEDS
ncbi:MAG: hypothetical protein DRO73_07680 [Candidatus Thorarchaeota archaeon]|nr:MAG: hypothetical protein DRO73_07680 [Candidatus Thorarchaeota archaeon]